MHRSRIKNNNIHKCINAKPKKSEMIISNHKYFLQKNGNILLENLIKMKFLVPPFILPIPAGGPNPAGHFLKVS